MMIVGIAVWPEQADAINRAGIGLVCLVIGVNAALRPKHAKAVMVGRQPTAHAKTIIGSWSETQFRAMGVFFLCAALYLFWTAAWLIWPHHVFKPPRLGWSFRL